jgi:hypothetical protein
MPRAKKNPEVKEEVKTEKPVKAAAAKAKAAVKATNKKIADKKTAEKIEAKKTAAKAGTAVKKTTTAAKAAVKKPAAKARAAKLDLIFQSPMGGAITPDEIAKKLPKGAKKAYVRIDENKIYWVNGEETGSVEIW